MPVDEYKVQEAFSLVDEAELLATQGEFAKSVYKFQLALDLFYKSGLPVDQRQTVVDMVSTRQNEVNKIKEYLQEHPEEREMILAELLGDQNQQTAQENINAQTVPTNKQSLHSAEPYAESDQTSDMEKIEMEGLRFLEIANKLVNDGHYVDSINFYYNAVEKLIQANWNEAMLSNIQDTILQVSEKVRNQTQPQESLSQSELEEYIPTFAQVEGNQDQQFPTSNHQLQNHQQQEYTPTFASMAGSQGQQAAQPTPQQLQNQQQQEYTPTFASMAGSQGQQAAQPTPQQLQNQQQQEYTPTFASMAGSQGQPSVQPTPQQLQNQQQQEYTPTFASAAGTQGQPAAQPTPQQMQNQQQQEYTPTFASMAGSQGQPSVQPTPQQMQNQQQQEYTPTFASVAGTQGQSANIPAIIIKNQEEPYIPTFSSIAGIQNHDEAIKIQETQKGFTPEPYVPTFANAEVNVKAENVYDPDEIKKMISATQGIQINQPTFSSIGQDDIISAQPVKIELDDGPSFASVGQEDIITATPVKYTEQKEASYVLVEKKQEITHKGQNLLEEVTNQRDILLGMQMEAFELINNAKELENESEYELSIENLEDALAMFKSMPSWQYECSMIFTRISVINEKMLKDDHTIDNQAIERELLRIAEDFPACSDESSLHRFANIDSKAEDVYEIKIQEQNAMQKSLISLLQKGLKDIENEEYENSLNHYHKSTIILSTLDWTAQKNQASQLIENINNLINELGLEKYEDLELTGLLGRNEQAIQEELQKIQNIQNEKLLILEEKKISRQRTQEEAFSIIDNAEKHIKEKNFKEAIKSYEEATNKLIEAGWHEQVQKLSDRILQIRKMESDAYEQIQAKQEEKIVQVKERGKIEKEFALKQRKLAEEERIKHKGIEEELLSILDKAAEDLSKNNFDTSFEFYENAMIFAQENSLKEQIAYIESLQNAAKLRKDRYIQHQKELLAKQEKAAKEQQQFENYLKQQAKFFEQQYTEKEERIKSFEEKRKNQKELQNRAYGLMEEADKYLRNKEFDSAKFSFKEAHQTFLSLGWKIDINKQLQKVEEERKQHNLLLEQMKESQMQVQMQEKQALQQQQNMHERQLSQLDKISQMIGQAKQNKEEIAQKSGESKDERTKQRDQLLAWKKKKPITKNDAWEKIRSLRGSIMESVKKKEESVKIEKEREEELKKKQEIKEQEKIDDITAMIRAAAKKKKE